MNIKKHLSLLGLKVKDRVTGQEGTVTSVCFDLYGCIQGALHPGLDEKGNPRDSFWLDVSRLEILGKKPVMPVPDFDFGPQAEGRQGPAEKPKLNKF